MVQTILGKLRTDVRDKTGRLLVCHGLNQPPHFCRVRRLVIAVGDDPILPFSCENRFGLRRSLDRDAVELVFVKADQVAIAKIVRFGVQDLLDGLRYSEYEATWSEAHIDFLLSFLWRSTDL